MQVSKPDITFIDEELYHGYDNNNMAVNKKHSEEEATVPTATATASTATPPTTTASPATETVKRQLAPFSFSISPESSGSSSKRPRLDLAVGEAARNPEISPSPTSIMSSLQHLSNLHPPGDVNETGDTSTWPSVTREYAPPSIMEPPYNAQQWDVPPFYQPQSPSTLSSQPGADLHPCDPVPTAADFETQTHQPQPSTPQNMSSSPSRVLATRKVRRNPMSVARSNVVVSIDKQKRQISSGTGTASHLLTLSKPAQAKDLEAFPWRERHLVWGYSKTEQGKNDVDFKQWYSEIARAFWAQTMISRGKPVPSSLYNLVLGELCMSHPCVTDPWSGHALYKALLLTKRKKPGRLTRLEDWMYGSGTTTQATWRDTLSIKMDSSHQKVPWVQREKIIALSVILACVDTSKSKTASKSLQSKFELLEKCKLTYLLSNQDHVTANEYWDGFAEELAEDPEQEHLYDKVMRARQSTTSETSSAWSVLPIVGQEASRKEEPGYQRESGFLQQGGHSGETGPGGVGGLRTTVNAEDDIHEHPGSHDVSNPAHQSFYLAENAHQDTQYMTNDATWLQDMARQAEAEVTELHRHTEFVYQQFSVESAATGVMPAGINHKRSAGE